MTKRALIFYNLIFNGTDNEIGDQLHQFYSKKDVLVTGGASFIGSHLVESLLRLGAKVKIIDDFTSGQLENLKDVKNVTVNHGDLAERQTAFAEVEGHVVFHLAAVHGGRGFIETFKQDMLVNFAIDNNVFSAAKKAGTSRIVHASSACAYPINLQSNEESRNLLSEDLASMNSPETSFADGVYGWTKLLGEYQLENFCDGKMTGRSARIFTAYGERENESHAAIALIAKALLKPNVFPIWGNGEQTRNFTHVSDTVLGLLLLGCQQSNRDFDVFNIGTSAHIKVIDFVKEIFKQLNWEPKGFDLQINRPTGVASRASDNSKMLAEFRWEPRLPIALGLERTIMWYRDLPSRAQTWEELESKLNSR